MRPIQILILLGNLFGINNLALAQRKAVVQVLETQKNAWNNGNLKAFMQTYWKSDSLTFMGKNGPNYGWQKTYDRYLSSYPNQDAMGKLDFKILKISMIGKEDAHVIGAWHLRRKNDAPQGFFTLLLHKFNNGWKIVVDHTS